MERGLLKLRGGADRMLGALRTGAERKDGAWLLTGVERTEEGV